MKLNYKYAISMSPLLDYKLHRVKKHLGILLTAFSSILNTVPSI